MLHLGIITPTMEMAAKEGAATLQQLIGDAEGILDARLLSPEDIDFEMSEAGKLGFSLVVWGEPEFIQYEAARDAIVAAMVEVLESDFASTERRLLDKKALLDPPSVASIQNLIAEYDEVVEKRVRDKSLGIGWIVGGVVAAGGMIAALAYFTRKES